MSRVLQATCSSGNRIRGGPQGRMRPWRAAFRRRSKSSVVSRQSSVVSRQSSVGSRQSSVISRQSAVVTQEDRMRFAVAVITIALSSALIAQDGWVSLFDGKTLNGWTTIGGVRWTVVDGAMSAEPASQPIPPTGAAKQTWPQGFLRSVESFRDFEMTAEFWSEEDTNSGLFIRCATPANPGSLGSCYEINI